MNDIEQLAQEIHQQNVDRGWWSDPNRCLKTVCMLIVSELAEAMEGHRKNIMDDHLPHRKMVEVELADAFIRLLDLGGKLNLTHTGNTSGPALGEVPVMLLECVQAVCCMSDYIDADAHALASLHYSEALAALSVCAECHGYDLEGAMLEKLEYNKKRADHDLTNRAAANGKRY